MAQMYLRGDAQAALDLTTRLLPYGTDSGAILSPCRRFRYRLWRSWGEREKRVAFLGLNPSTADESADDPTIRKCVGFAKRWGFGAIDMVNLFALRSTDPKGLLANTADVIGDENNTVLDTALAEAQRVVFAWGSHGAKINRLVKTRLTDWQWDNPKHVECGTLGHAKDGSPRHPLMLAYATPFERA